MIIKKIKSKNIKKVYLVSFILTYGYHGKTHIAGESKNSWKNILIDNGFDVTVIPHGLGRYKDFIDIYIYKIKEKNL